MIASAAVIVLAGLSAIFFMNRDTPAAEKITAVSSETAVYQEPTSKPTATPTPKPTGKPTPTPSPSPEPSSVYIPGEELPDGRLFDEKYYAVLPGEGAYYNVFNCYGEMIDSFFFDTGYGDEPIGLLTEEELSLYHRLNSEKVKLIKFTDQEYSHSDLISYENGFYQMWYGESSLKAVLYNKDGKHIRTLSFDNEPDQFWANLDIICHGEETVVVCWSQPGDWDGFLNDTTTTVFFISRDGTISDKIEVERPNFILIGRKYISTDDDTISDLNGNILMKDVSYLHMFSTRIGYGDSPYEVVISDYFIKDGVVFDSSLRPVAKNTTLPDGNLIYDLEYDVSGIPCKAVYDKCGNDFDWPYDISQLTAIGFKDQQVGVKTAHGEYVIDLEDGQKFCGINQFGYLLYDEYHNTIQIASLETRKVLCSINAEPPYSIPDDYFVLGTNTIANGENVRDWFIYDKEGNRRYEVAYFFPEEIMPGEYILLYRGPYVGIADLNGEWILKTLTWEMKRDAAEVEAYY